MASREMVRLSYNSARDEILSRLKMRDQLLLAFLVIVGTISGLWIHSRDLKEILLLIPFLTLGVTIMIYHHSEVMAQLGHFCSKELEEFMNKFDPPEYSIHWDNSETYRSFSDRSTKQRTLVNIIILLTPVLMALGVNFSHACSGNVIFLLLWWFGVILLFIILMLILKSYLSRAESFSSRWENES